jgi:hypothetical protein
MKFDPCFAAGFFLGVIGGIAIITVDMRQAPAPATAAVVASQVQFQN